ncbi:hypothetical protein niasHS_007596 [Heterodera schachtii]|uniref:DOCKER domain-containing protein n=1 Tax=Heterodera schachtii TaxID=97005 RepID=A0ABD2JP41_HETSC
MSSSLDDSFVLPRDNFDTIRLVDVLHLKLNANAQRGLIYRVRCFDSLALTHKNAECFSEAAVCQAHSLAIVGRLLQKKGLLTPLDWSVLDVLNEQIAAVETVDNVTENSTAETFPNRANFGISDFLRRFKELTQNLMLAKRYEAIGPICRLIIPLFERNADFKSLIAIHSQIQQAYQCVDQITTNVIRRQQLASYFRVTFHGRAQFGEDHGSEWIYRERPLTSLAEACDRLRESVQSSLANCRVQLLNTANFPPSPPPPRLSSSKCSSSSSFSSVSSLLPLPVDDPCVAYIGVAHVEPCKTVRTTHSSEKANCGGKLGGRAMSRSRCELASMNGSTFGLAEEEGEGAAMEVALDPTNYWLHTNVRTFVLNERQADSTVSDNAPELARMTLRRTTLTVENPFPGTRRRQRVVHMEQTVLSSLEFACESILQKADQIRHILSSAGLRRCRHHHNHHRLINCGYDKSVLKRVDVKQLQLFLQGAVMPTVNAGLLAYAETFTAPAQQKRYGNKGLLRLWNALK